MGFGTAVSTCFRKYATFTGRAARPEFWYFVLFIWLVFMAAGAIAAAGAGSARSNEVPPGLIVLLVAWLAVMLPNWAVTVRRLHDTDHSGWYIFISLIPFVGGIILLVTLAQEGTAGPNRYGADPLGRTGLQPLPPATPTRRCPYCAEFIQQEALVCRFCGRDLSASPTQG